MVKDTPITAAQRYCLLKGGYKPQMLTGWTQGMAGAVIRKMIEATEGKPEVKVQAPVKKRFHSPELEEALTALLPPKEEELPIVGQVAEIYADGGVIGRNPSSTGGTWAYVYVDAADNKIDSDSGVLLPGDVDLCGLEVVTNNTSELMAVVYALENLPDGWKGLVCTDSQVTMQRLQKPAREWVNVPEDLKYRACTVMGRLGAFKWRLIGGHPTPQELKRGSKANGHITSKWNVLADEMCGRATVEHFKTTKEVKPSSVSKTNMPQVQAIRALGRYVVHCPYCGLDHSHTGVGLQQSGCENGALPYWVEGAEL